MAARVTDALAFVFQSIHDTMNGIDTLNIAYDVNYQVNWLINHDYKEIIKDHLKYLYQTDIRFKHSFGYINRYFFADYRLNLNDFI